jgi:hypothetical protein
VDPAWGSGLAIAGSQVTSPADGGAHLWNGGAFGADQYSQITLGGQLGDWTGVAVRAGASPARGYWVAVKADGAHLYSYTDGVFRELAYDATPWSAGDVLRLEVRTVAPGTARLSVLRNGAPLLVADDAETFIENGDPAIGMHGPGALDDWAGGALDAATPPPPPPPPPPASSAQDDFERADGALGASWLADPAWGNGASLAGGAVVCAPSNGAAYYWAADAFGADQYSQITLSGEIADWTGVVVRGAVSPAQGYWVAVKPDGAHLYSLSGGVFHALAHDATPWSTGDVLRLEVESVAPFAARLTVFRNGAPLFAHDDADHFLDGGRPGIGLHATGLVSLDDWAGGMLSPAE